MDVDYRLWKLQAPALPVWARVILWCAVSVWLAWPTPPVSAHAQLPTAGVVVAASKACSTTPPLLSMVNANTPYRTATPSLQPPHAPEPLTPLPAPPSHPAPEQVRIERQSRFPSLPVLAVFILILSAAGGFLLMKYLKRSKMTSQSPAGASAKQPDAHLKDLDNAWAPGVAIMEVTRAKTTIGRDPRNDIVIKKPTISTLHATIEYRNMAFYLEDQRSTNGTRLNNRKLQPNMPVRLKSGDRIQLATFGFTFVIPAQIPFSETVMLGMTPLEGPEPGSTIVLDLDSTGGEQSLIGCMQNHLMHLYSMGAKYREFCGSHFTYDIQSNIAARAHECLSQTQVDEHQHCQSFVRHQALYLVCSLPVAIGHAAEWYGAQYGGFTRFILKWLQSQAFASAGCDTLCLVTFGQDPSTWVSLTIVPTHQEEDPVEIMSVDFLNASEKAMLNLNFDRHGRVQ